MATANVLVHASVSEQFEKELASQMSQHRELLQASAASTLANSDGSSSGSHKLRGLFSTASAIRVKDIWTEASNQGAVAIAGEPGFDLDLGVVQPVFVKATPSMPIFTQELFAPIVGVYPYSSDEEATELANGTGMGLTSSVFSQNETHAWKLATEIDSGAVHINGLTVHDDPNVPHGGARASGYGRFNGLEGIREFTYLKDVTISPGVMIPFQAL